MALHSTRPSRRLDYAGVMAVSPANRKEPRYSQGGNRVRRKHDILTNRPLYDKNLLLARPLVLDAARVKKICFSLSFIPVLLPGLTEGVNRQGLPVF